MRKPLMGLSLFVSVLVVLTFPAGAQAPDIEQSLATSQAWMLDHHSGVGYRAADRQLRGTEKFAQSLPNGYSPAQMRHGYGFDGVFTEGDGQIIGIVDPFHYPTAASDLKQFIRTFRLRSMYGLPGRGTCTVAYGPHPCFQVVYAEGSQPAVDASWDFESAIDIEWAHAIAPGADILFVESATNAFVDLLAGVDRAVNEGSTVVSMSWGSPEAAPETVLDHHFSVTGVTFVAAIGDIGHALIYPAVSPNVLSVGGTRLHLNRTGERIAPETAWSNSGGGISPFEPEPAYQSHYPIPNTSGFRGNPDVAYDADPATGVAVFDSTPLDGLVGWYTAGGTSIGAPQWAGLIALANELRSFSGAANLSSNDPVHRPQYDAAVQPLYPFTYYDITSGSDGTCGATCRAARGYDFVTGLGSPRASVLVPVLAGLGLDFDR